MSCRLLFKHLLFLALISFYSLNNLHGQVDKEFWFAIPKETSSHGYLNTTFDVSFKITNQSDVVSAHVEISMPANSGFTTRVIDIPPSQSYVEQMATNFPDFANIYASPSSYDATATTGYTNHGIYIKSDVEITVYYDFNNYYNRDLFSLKGSNSLGKDFRLPFQNIWNNNYNASVPPKYSPDVPFSSACIVASENNTTVTINPTNAIEGVGASPYSITLNKGQTYTIVAASVDAALHLSGTRVTSDKPIAITINDDSVPIDGQTCFDIIGDQIIPTTVVGTDYLVMTGKSSTTYTSAAIKETRRGEQIIVTALHPNTVVDFYKKDGSLLHSETINNSQLTTYISPDITDLDQQAIYVHASDSIYVLHITGITCEMGGAIVPPITNCTGSTEVSFYRSSIADNGSSTMTLNLMIPYDTNLPWDAVTQSHNFFTLQYQNGTTKPIPASWFEPVPGAGWVVLKSIYKGNEALDTLIPINQAVKIINDKDFFHLGITNGYSGQTNKYGYFSSFNATKASAVVATVNEVQHLSCFGDTVYLRAQGGLEYTWHYGAPDGPPTYLSNNKVSTPRVFCPPGVHDFYVVVRQSKCFGDDTLKVQVRVLPEIKAYIESDTTAACSPFRAHITNKSTGATRYSWSYQKDNNSPITFTPPNPTSFVQPATGQFENITSPYKPIVYTYKLIASNYGRCPETAIKQIVVYPFIKANFFPLDTTSCHPTLINFRNLSNGNVADSLYQWDFGDGNTTPVKNPTHIFENLYRADDTTYNVRLVATSPYYCRDTARSNVTVYPYIKASFTADTVRGCSPFTAKIRNNSLNKPAISEYLWDFGDGTTRITNNDTLMHAYPVNTSASPITYKLLLTVRHKYNTGCPDTISRFITVNPQTSVSFITNPGSNTICDSTIVKFTTTASAAVTSYEWVFGDGNTSNLQNPSHLFNNLTNSDKTYHVSLTVKSNDYCDATASKDFIVHAFLDPRFSIDVPSNCAPFNASIKNKSKGGIVKYDWDYGDNSSDHHTIADTIHTYRNTSYVVKYPVVSLIVTNSGGCTDTLTQQVRVNPEIKASFTPSKIIGCNPLPVSFLNKSTLLDSVSRKYYWEFGDNTTSSDKHPDHLFSNTSSNSVVYPVRLTVTSSYNCSDDTVINIHLYPFLKARFTVDSTKGCSPFPVQIHNASSGNITQYQWEFAPGNVAINSSSNFTQTYTNKTTIPTDNYLKLIASNTNGICQSRDSILITTYPEVNSQFVTNATEGCNPLTIRYTNQSGPGSVPVEYDWIFGDGGTDRNKNTSHSFQNLTSKERTYNTQLIATSIYKCKDTSNLDIKVYPFIEADFSFDKAEGCSPHTIIITNSSSPGSKGFNWTFGDGQTSTSSTPGYHVYRNLGTTTQTFTPRLIVDYNGRCQDTITQSLQVYPEVTANFNQDTLRGCHPLKIKFTENSRNENEYDWKFGDRGTSGLGNPDHTYFNFSTVDSVYNVKLRVKSMFDCKDSITKQVIVYARPKALFDIKSTVDCPPFNVTISNLTQAADFYTWTFGDGDTLFTTNLDPITHTYDNHTPNIATYNLNLFVQSVYNCTNQLSQTIDVYPRVLADFAPDTSGCSPLLVPFDNKTVRAVTYKWDFGDKITSALRSPSHKFFNNSMDDTTFNVRMIGFSEFDCSDTAYHNVLIHPQPTVEFSALPSYLYYPDARVNIDNQTNPGHWTYDWNFDDGQTSSDIEPTIHEYLHWGTFNIVLKAWSDYCSDSISHRVRVFAPKTIADFDASGNGCVPHTVNFTNHSTWATSYKWEFDDGSVSTETNPSHIYQNPGKYQVKLTTYGDGEEDVTYREVEVYPKPKVEFNVSPRYVMLPDALVHYYNTSKGGSYYLWDFGDGDTSNVFEPEHTYDELGTFDVTLNVWTEHQCFDSIVMPDAVQVDGEGKIIFPNAFTPNKEGPNGGAYDLRDKRNDIFYPYHEGIEDYKLEIYDRWGELLFESKDVNIGWDGYYKGNLCKSDVYIWKSKGKFYNGHSFNKAGDVTLLK